MGQTQAVVQGEAAVVNMLRAAGSPVDLSPLGTTGSLEGLPDIDQILGSPSLEAAFSPEPMAILAKDVFRGFFLLGAQGFAFASSETIREQFGRTLAENYPGAGAEFLAFATTYWTLKQVHWNLFASQRELPLTQLISWLEENVGAVFFPTPGPMSMPTGMRKQAQRNLLDKTGSPLNADTFIQGNPILRKSASGFRFVPITSGLAAWAILGVIFWLFGSNIITWLLAVPLAWFGWSSLRVGLFGSQKLIGEMTLKTEGDLSKDAIEEWRKINKLD